MSFVNLNYFIPLSYKIERGTNSFKIIKDKEIILTDCDEETWQPNINFSVSRHNDMKGFPKERFITKFFSFPYIRHSTIFISISSQKESITKLI